jgi:hypothetical protein
MKIIGRSEEQQQCDHDEEGPQTRAVLLVAVRTKESIIL